MWTLPYNITVRESVNRDANKAVFDIVVWLLRSSPWHKKIANMSLLFKIASSKAICNLDKWTG